MTNQKTVGFACELEFGNTGKVWHTLSVWEDWGIDGDFWSFQLYRHDGSGYPVLRFGYKIPVNAHSQPGWRPLFWDLEDSRDDAYKLHTLWRELEDLAQTIDLIRTNRSVPNFKATKDQEIMSRTALASLQNQEEIENLLEGITDVTYFELACVGLDGFSEPLLPPELDIDKIDFCTITQPDLNDGEPTLAPLNYLPSCFVRDQLGFEDSFREFSVKMTQGMSLQPNGVYAASFKLDHIHHECTVTLTMKD